VGFYERYHKELSLKQNLIQTLLDAVKKNDVTLLYGAKDEKMNNAIVLKEHLGHFASQHIKEA
jgi:uncharacterized protein YeaO (DUF488 family)